MEIAEINTIPIETHLRLEEMINRAWEIFINHFINKKYEINLEAPFQLHFASILKQVGELYCLQKRELITINLEVDMGDKKKNYIDIVIEFFEKEGTSSFTIPVELKFKTKQQSAVDEGVMAIYKDIYNLENLKKKNFVNEYSILDCYFFFITDCSGYINKAKKGLKTVFDTSDGNRIRKGFEYKYIENITGRKFHKNNGSLVFSNNYDFHWEEYEYNNKSKHWFLKVKI